MPAPENGTRYAEQSNDNRAYGKNKSCSSPLSNFVINGRVASKTDELIDKPLKYAILELIIIFYE